MPPKKLSKKPSSKIAASASRQPSSKGAVRASKAASGRASKAEAVADPRACRNDLYTEYRRICAGETPAVPQTDPDYDKYVGMCNNIKSCPGVAEHWPLDTPWDGVVSEVRGKYTANNLNFRKALNCMNDKFYAVDSPVKSTLEKCGSVPRPPPAAPGYANAPINYGNANAPVYGANAAAYGAANAAPALVYDAFPANAAVPVASSKGGKSKVKGAAAAAVGGAPKRRKPVGAAKKPKPKKRKLTAKKKKLTAK